MKAAVYPSVFNWPGKVILFDQNVRQNRRVVMIILRNFMMRGIVLFNKMQVLKKEEEWD